MQKDVKDGARRMPSVRTWSAPNPGAADSFGESRPALHGRNLDPFRLLYYSAGAFTLSLLAIGRELSWISALIPGGFLHPKTLDAANVRPSATCAISHGRHSSRPASTATAQRRPTSRDLLARGLPMAGPSDSASSASAEPVAADIDA